MMAPAAAYHAAAHAVMQFELGRPVGSVTTTDFDRLHVCGDGFIESARFSDFDTVVARTALLHDCVSLIAGYIVEAHFLFLAVHRLSRWAVREKQELERVVQLVEPDVDAARASQRYVEETARAMLDDRDVIYRLNQLGDLLGRRTSLTGQEVMDAIRDVDRLVRPHRRCRWHRPLPPIRGVVDPASPRLRPAGSALGAQPAGTPIETLGLSPFALSTLRKRGSIHTVEQLRTSSRAELLSIRTLGQQTLAEIVEALRRVGIWLR
jgi:hypothetical protein